MSTKHIQFQPKLHVPVDELEIIGGPSGRIIRLTLCAYLKTDGIKARFRVKTLASTVDFHVSGTVYDARERKLQDGSPGYGFMFHVNGWNYYGEYNPHTRVGTLTACYSNPYDPTDSCNLD
jgi:hypothetical protein